VTLARDVAIKVLPAAFTSSPDRLARFEREARMLAALNHPNICGIYGLEEVEGSTVPDSRTRRGRDARRANAHSKLSIVDALRSRDRSPMRSKRRTKKASSIAT
jgi:serine/threonine protein kinase